MKHRPRPPEQADLLRPRLVDMIDGGHELVRLAALIDWPWFEREWAGFFPAGEGRPATHPRLVAGLLYLQHTFNLSDEAVLARWVENPYFQHFTGEPVFQHRPPTHPSSLSRWRGRIGEEGVEWLLTKTIEAGRACGAVQERSLSEILGFQVGLRESAQSWRELLVDLKARGLVIAAELATGDGGLGFWKALEEVCPATRHQRCWVHKAANVLDKLPRSVQPAAKADLREVWQAPDRDMAEAAIATFAGKYGAKYEKAATCLLKDRNALLTFYDFPAEHWDHLRTSNPIESVFATVRHRTVRTKGALSQDTARLMVFKLVMAAAKTWRRLKGENQLPKLIQGVTFHNGVEVTNTPAQNAA